MLTSVFTFILLSLSSADYFSVDVKEDQKTSIEAKNIFFIGHATSFWDNGKTKDTTTSLVQLSRNYPITTVATVSDVMQEEPLARNHYFVDKDIDYVVLSRAGQHSLQFPNAKNIFFAGGNLGRCLCEGIRDLARGVVFSNNFNSVNFYMIRGAIYDSYPPFYSMSKETASDFTNLFLSASFDCPRQNWKNKPRQKMSDVRIRLFYDNEYLQDFDLDNKDSIELGDITKTINIHFIDSSRVKNLFESLEP